ncbi:DHA2 family efflux MFS transporter permease subunit [Paenibacillus pinistramenti]|uniref:DHA2 family efflux MFS transporter permease subunit n=1 Tax=Paenibacillus pinistramenti TaxID=1768003 RepID=UPI001108EF60|nr:DHA2 family efflux MFS transporter permease subunit [Paenibacillus pinistramenti]
MKNKYLILLIVVIGAFVGNLEAVLPNTAVNVIANSLGASVNNSIWILTIYTLLFATFMPLASKIGAIIGNRNLYIWSLILFSVFSFLCGITNSLVLLIIFRGLQGIAISACLPCAMVIISHHFQAQERGKAMGILGMVVASSTAIGAPLGGILTDYLGWHSIFYIVAPLSILAFLSTLFVIPKEDKSTGKTSFDFYGAIFFSSFMIFLMLLISAASKSGVFSVSNGIFAVLTIVSFIAFIVVEKRVKSPFIPLQLFQNVSFNSISISRALQMAMLYGSLFLIPLYWSEIYNHSPKETGLALFLLPITIMIVSPIVGNYIDRLGSKLFMVLGMIFTSLGALGLVIFSGDIWSVSMTIDLVILGIGFAMMQSSAMAAVTLVLPKEQLNVGVGIFNMLTFAGGTIGLSLFSSLVEYTGFRGEFIIMLFAGLLGLLVSLKAKVSVKTESHS